MALVRCDVCRKQTTRLLVSNGVARCAMCCVAPAGPGDKMSLDRCKKCSASHHYIVLGTDARAAKFFLEEDDLEAGLVRGAGGWVGECDHCRNTTERFELVRILDLPHEARCLVCGEKYVVTREVSHG